MSSSITAIVKIQNKLGLHARPAMMFVEMANRFDAAVRVRRTDQDDAIDGKAILQMMMLAATRGTELEITADGEDAQDAVCELVKLVDSRFQED